MIADLKPYPEYRESELPWLVKFPATWKMLRGKSVFGRVDVRSKTGLEELLTVSANHGVIPRRQTSVTMFMAKSYIGHKLCWPGDLVVNSLWAWMQGLGVAKNHGLISSAYSVYRPRAEYLEYGNFFHLLFRCNAYKWELQTRSKGVWISRLQLTDIAFMDMPVLLPPPGEQASIVRFLNHANLRIEKAIRAKRKVTALLNEQKQVIIHRAVTRGLDPNVKLKPSGIPWLGEIPEHWEVRPVKQLLSSMDYGTSESIRGDGRIRVLTMGNIRDGKIALPKEGGLTSIPKGLLLETNDLLFNRTNSPDLVGKVGLFTGDATDEITFASYLVRLRARLEHSPQWLNLMLNSTQFWAYARSQALVSLHQANLNSKRYGQMLIPVPPHDEQQEIFKVVSIQTKDIEIAISHAEREIDLLREYRTRLIADVVTGKLDVREAAAGLPDEVEELAILQDSDETAELDDNDAEDES